MSATQQLFALIIAGAVVLGATIYGEAVGPIQQIADVLGAIAGA